MADVPVSVQSVLADAVKVIIALATAGVWRMWSTIKGLVPRVSELERQAKAGADYAIAGAVEERFAEEAARAREALAANTAAHAALAAEVAMMQRSIARLEGRVGIGTPLARAPATERGTT